MTKQLAMIPLSLLLVGWGGCSAPDPHRAPPDMHEKWVSGWLNTAMANEAIIVERVLYPYHFSTGSADLNGVGAQALEVLAEHYLQENRGELSIRRGDASEDLYQARVAMVVQYLSAVGFGAEQITITQSAPGGNGMHSEQLLIILAERASLGALSTSAISGGD